MSESERRVAQLAGVERQRRAEAAGYVPTGRGSAEQHGRGVVCEMALAKWLGVYYCPSLVLDGDTGDVANLQVRSSRRNVPMLHVRPNRDHPQDPYVLVAWLRPGVCGIVGWEYAATVIERGQDSDAWGYPTKCMAGSMLLPAETIPSVLVVPPRRATTHV